MIRPLSLSRAQLRIGGAVLVTFAFACAAPAASATTYCVGSAPSCTGTSEPDLTTALAAANGDTTGVDTIILPTGTQTSPGGFIYSGTRPLIIDGQGTGSILTIGTGSATQPVFTDGAGGEKQIELRQLEVSLPSGESAGGVALTAFAQIVGVAVTGASGSEGYGIALGGGGAVADASVSIPPGTGALPDPGIVAMGTPASTIEDSVVSDRTGIEDGGPGALTIHRCALTAANSGAGIYALGSSVAADDSLIVATASASGLEAYGASTGGSTITAAQLTIAGDSTATGVHVQEANGNNALVDITDSIIADPLQSSFALVTKQGDGGTSTATTDYDDFDQKSVSGAVTIGAHDTNISASAPSGFVNPQFANTSKNNYRLLPASPVLNFDPTPIGGTPVGSVESTTDLAGEPRIGPSGRDLGAYQHQSPTATASATPTTAKVNTGISFSSTGKILYSQDPLRYNWHFDDGTIATGQNVTHAFTTGGTHTATVTVADLLGFTATATVTVSIQGPPTISHVSQSASKWRTGKALAHISKARSKKSPVGTTFKFTLSEAATVTFTFTGHKGHKHYSGHLTFSGNKGANTVRFDGRVSSRNKLSPASYKLAITAKAFGLTASPSTLRFTIEPPQSSRRR
jgi:hypothetical protein